MTRDARSRSPICQGDRLARERGRGVAEANATISGYLFAAAKTGNITAIIFWLKTRAHWSERPASDEPVPAPMPSRTQRWSSSCPAIAEIRS